MKSKLLIPLVALLFISLACSEDDPDPADLFSVETFEGTANINPNNFPSGIGLKLTEGDTGRLVQLDEVNLDWDIQVITYRTAQGGRPGIILYGDDRNSNAATQAVNISSGMGVATGSTGFESFNLVTTAMQQALSADSEFLFNAEIDTDDKGRADIDILEAAYADLIIGDRIVNLEEADQPVYLVKSRDGVLFKFQMVNREQGGATTLRWARFADSAIE